MRRMREGFFALADFFLNPRQPIGNPRQLWVPALKASQANFALFSDAFDKVTTLKALYFLPQLARGDVRLLPHYLFETNIESI